MLRGRFALHGRRRPCDRRRGSGRSSPRVYGGKKAEALWLASGPIVPTASGCPAAMCAGPSGVDPRVPHVLDRRVASRSAVITSTIAVKAVRPSARAQLPTAMPTCCGNQNAKSSRAIISSRSKPSRPRSKRSGAARLNCRRSQKRPTKATFSMLPQVGQRGVDAGPVSRVDEGPRQPRAPADERLSAGVRGVPRARQYGPGACPLAGGRPLATGDINCAARSASARTAATRPKKSRLEVEAGAFERPTKPGRPAATPSTSRVTPHDAARRRSAPHPVPPAPRARAKPDRGGAGGGPTVPLVPAQRVSRAWETGAGR